MLKVTALQCIKHDGLASGLDMDLFGLVLTSIDA